MKKNTLPFLVAVILSADVQAQEVLRIQNGAVMSIQSGTSLTITGGVMLENGSTVANNGKISLLRNSVAGNADWIDSTDGPYGYGSGTVVFNSSGDQALWSANSFHRIEINAGSIRLGTDIAADQWYLIKGRVSTGNFRAIALSPADSAVKADARNANFTHSWFDGRLRRSFNGNSATTFFLPLGDPHQANLAVLDNLKTAPLNNITYFDASFGPKPGTDDGLVLKENGTAYTMVNGAGVWYITPDKEPTQGRYDLLLYLDGFTGLEDNSFSVLRRPDSSTTANEWEVPEESVLPEGGKPGRTVAGGYARRNNISSFSQYGIGMSSTPLPVTLIDFKAYRINKTEVALQWQTEMESNNKGFDVERRLDKDAAFSFSGAVPSAAPGGNSSTVLSYSYTDANDYYGISYYRLKQTDLDGHYTYTLIKAVSGSGGTGISVLLYPNPNHGQFTIRIDGTFDVHYVRIIDEKGAVIKNMLLNGNTSLPVTGLRPGAYIVQIPDAFGSGQTFAEKILVIR
jgi:hypothetical protein